MEQLTFTVDFRFIGIGYFAEGVSGGFRGDFVRVEDLSGDEVCSLASRLIRLQKRPSTVFCHGCRPIQSICPVIHHKVLLRVGLAISGHLLVDEEVDRGDALPLARVQLTQV